MVFLCNANAQTASSSERGCIWLLDMKEEAKAPITQSNFQNSINDDVKQFFKEKSRKSIVVYG